MSSRMLALLAVCALLGGGGCKKESGSPALPQAERSREVDFVWYSVRDGKPEGGTTPAKVIIKPNPSGEVRVAVYEEYSGGAGNQWRASAWMASFLSSSLLNRNLSDYEFGVSTGGFVDGPSAGGLTTAALLAAMNDVPVKAEVTMTGTINPDGSIGPVGGIPQKIAGAAANGKKVFGYPVGQRYDLDMESGKLVDLHCLAQEKSVEVKELRDIYDAYELLSGKTLPRPTPVDASAMEISPRYFQRMQAKTTAWLAKTESSIALLKQQDGSKLANAIKLLDLTDEAYRRAKNYQRQGMVPAAFAASMEAAAYAELCQHVLKQMHFVLKNDLRGALLEVRSLSSVSADEAALRATLATETPATASEALSLIEGYSSAAAAKAFIGLAQLEEQDIERVIEGLQKGRIPAEWAPAMKTVGAQKAKVLAVMLGMKSVKPTLYYLLARLYVDGARDLLDAREAAGKPLKLEPRAVLQLARSYTSAAKANFDYYDALVLQAEADREGASLAAAKAQKAQEDLEYLHAMRILQDTLHSRESTDLHGALANLAASTSVYLSSAKLVAREYSLGVHKDEKGELMVRNDKAFMSMLENSEQKAREQAAVAMQLTGAVPGPAQGDYQLARALREKDTDSKLSVLSHFWSSSVMSQLAVQLSAGAPTLVAADQL